MRNIITKIYYPATNTYVWFRNGRRIETMDKKFDTLFRTGKSIDMMKEIEELQSKYSCDLQASVDTSDTYDQVSENTYSDLAAVICTLEVLCKLGYLFRDEANDMIEVAREQRKTVLEALEVRANEKSC